MEKRLIAFDCRPLRFFCGKCEKPFSMDETERVHRQTSTTNPSSVFMINLTIQEPHHTSNASIAEISAISRPYPIHLEYLIVMLTSIDTNRSSTTPATAAVYEKSPWTWRRPAGAGVRVSRRDRKCLLRRVRGASSSLRRGRGS